MHLIDSSKYHRGVIIVIDNDRIILYFFLNFNRGILTRIYFYRDYKVPIRIHPLCKIYN